MRRVVVTGMGMVTPLGDGVETNWRRLMAAESGIRVDPGVRHVRSARPRSPARCRWATGANGHFNADNYVAPKDQRKLDEFIIFGLAAAEQAVEDSGWKPQDDESRNRTGVMIGSGIGGLQTIDETSLILKERGPRRRQPVLHPVGADQPRLGPGLDQVRLQGPEPCGGDRLRHRRARASATRRG